MTEKLPSWIVRNREMLTSGHGYYLDGRPCESLGRGKLYNPETRRSERYRLEVAGKVDDVVRWLGTGSDDAMLFLGTRGTRSRKFPEGADIPLDAGPSGMNPFRADAFLVRQVRGLVHDVFRLPPLDDQGYHRVAEEKFQEDIRLL